MLLGSYTLLELIGRGGSAEVWRARTAQDAPVAVKVMKREACLVPAFRGIMEAEARALARLQHPNIVTVHDYGIARDTVTGPHGRVAADSPFLVLDLVDGGVVQAPLSWTQLKGVLVGLLDALAHAHARGILHLDVKPSNLLVARSGPVRLTDFGIAHWMGEARNALMCTPSFVAPEQVTREWRDWGPWTDLYALGGLTWALCTGRPPHRMEGREATLQAQLHGPLPVFEATYPVPAGLLGWLTNLLQKAHHSRYPCAALARAALLELGEPVGGFSQRTSPATHALHSTWVATPERAQMRRGPQRETEQASRPSRPQFELPASWRRTGAPSEVQALGLVAMRTPPVAGRTRAQGRLWQALLGAFHGARVGVRVVGEAGIGKSRLLGWIAEEAAEVGAFSVLQATMAEPGPSGLLRAIERMLRCQGLGRSGVRDRVELWLRRRGSCHEWLAKDLSGLLRIDTLGPEVPVDAGWRIATLCAVLREAAKHSPLAVVIDDAHLDAESEAVVAALMASEPTPFGILVIVGSRATHDVEGFQTLKLHPLQQSAVVRLLEGLLVLQASTADAVARRSGGNPLFAVQLVQELRERGRLRPTDKGFATEGDSPLALPDTLHVSWQSRIKKGERAALELAAVFGTAVQEGVWLAAAQRLALDLPTGLLDSLFRRGLVTASPKGFRFSHTLFAESLVRSAEEAGRAQALHQAAANTLQEVTPDGKARIGRHLLLAGLPLQAVDLLQEAAELARRRGERGAALARCDLALRAVQATEAADPRRGHLRLLRGLLTMEQGEPTQAAERMAVLADMAQEHGWVDIRGHAQRYIADHLHHCGQHEEAEALLREVAHRCTGQARRNTQGELGVLLIGRGRVQDGIASLERALSIASADPVQKIHDAFLAVYLERARGDLDAARGHAVRGLAMSTSLGWVRGQARFLSQQMWIEGRAGALEEALVLGRDARQLYRRVSLLDATTMDLKIADVLLQLGRIEEAEDTMAGLPAVFASYHREARLLDLHIMGLFCAATRQDTAAWDGHAKHLPEAQRLPSQGSFGYLEQAGDLALTHGWNTRAIRVFGAAAAVLEQMNRPADASRLRAKQNV